MGADRVTKPRKKPVGVTWTDDLPSRRAAAVEADGLLSHQDSPPQSPCEPITAADSLRIGSSTQHAVYKGNETEEAVEAAPGGCKVGVGIGIDSWIAERHERERALRQDAEGPASPNGRYHLL